MTRFNVYPTGVAILRCFQNSSNDPSDWHELRSEGRSRQSGRWWWKGVVFKQKLNVVIHAFNPGTHGTEAGITEGQGNSWLHNKFKISLGYMRPKKLISKIYKFQETNIHLSGCILYLDIQPRDFKCCHHAKRWWLCKPVGTLMTWFCYLFYYMCITELCAVYLKWMQFYLWIIPQWGWEQNKLGFVTSWGIYEILFNYFVPIAESF